MPCERPWRVKDGGDIFPALRDPGALGVCPVFATPPLACFSSADRVLGRFVCELLPFVEESSVTGHLLRGKV